MASWNNIALPDAPQEGAPSYVRTHGAPQCERFQAQRWILDNIIQANGMDWDQPRSGYLAGPGGAEAVMDFIGLRTRIRKLADAAPAFEAAAKRREARAKTFEEEGALVSARGNYFIASIHWGAAQWTIDESDDQNIYYNQRKRECYANYGRLADHHVESVWIKLGERAIPAWFHLPPGYNGGRIPCVVSIPGMDSLKESGVALNGDRWLSRGMAVLAVDGPGQYESPLVGVYVSIENWQEAAGNIMDWLQARPEIDGERIGVSGNSFGTLFSTIVAAAEPRFKACAVNAPCFEPGCHTIFEEASPTFKQRFMFMSNIQDEAKFNTFCKTISWEGHAQKVAMPYLCITGESDELSPLRYTEQLIDSMSCPRRLVIYQDSRHAVGGVPAAALGPFAPGLVADWMADRLAGKPMTSERWFVDGTGRVEKTPL